MGVWWSKAWWIEFGGVWFTSWDVVKEWLWLAIKWQSVLGKHVITYFALVVY